MVGLMLICHKLESPEQEASLISLNVRWAGPLVAADRMCAHSAPLAAELTDPAAAAGPLADSRARFLGVHSTD